MKKLVALLLVFTMVMSLVVVLVQERAEAASSAEIYTAWKNAERLADWNQRRGNMQAFASYWRQASKLRLMYFDACRKEGKKSW